MKLCSKLKDLSDILVSYSLFNWCDAAKMTRLYMIRSKSEFFCAKVTFFKCQGFAMLSEKLHRKVDWDCRVVLSFFGKQKQCI